MPSPYSRLTLLAFMLCIPVVSPMTPSAQGPACGKRNNNTHAKLQECVTLDGVRRHLEAFQAIADANGDTRASGTPGYDQSAQYVAGVLQEAGYNVALQPFTYSTFFELTPSVLEQLAPAPVGPIAHTIMSHSGSGDVTAPASPLAVATGCEASDFAGFPTGDIALILRGDCTFALKATNAVAAGASGVVIYNDIPSDLPGVLGNAFTLNVGVVGVAQDIGLQLAATPGLLLRLKTDTVRGAVTTANVIAESRGGDPSNVVVAGAHLDSVLGSPGIQDNGSGSAALLEVAVQMGKVKPRNKVRFIWFAAEEVGTRGAAHYVSTLSPEEQDAIALMLNFDMVGSPNYVFHVYDGDDSDGTGFGPGPAGSAAIEALFQSFYEERGYAHKGVGLGYPSDQQPFVAAGIPAGGLFTGAEIPKTVEEANLWGGTAGDPYDQCYHLSCDTFVNVSVTALEVNADAIAYAVLQYAMNTEKVNGRRGKGNFK
jgi:aminopeptidase Y